MNTINGQINFGLDLKINIDAQEETKAHGTDELYKLKVAKNFNI